MLTGNNEILTRAGEAKEQTDETSIFENISLAYNSGKIEKYTGTKNLIETMEEELVKIYGDNNVEVTDNGDDTYTVTVNEHKYNIVDGKIEKKGPVVNPYNPDEWTKAWAYTTDGKWSNVITEKTDLPDNYTIIAKLYEIDEANTQYSLVIEGKGEIKDLVDISDPENPQAYAWLSGILSNNNIFQSQDKKTKVIICDGITSIGDFAFVTRLYPIDSMTEFNNCTGLTSIDIPDSVTSIGTAVFVNCTGLRSIDIPDSVTSMTDGVFEECYITNIKLSRNVQFGTDVQSRENCLRDWTGEPYEEVTIDESKISGYLKVRWQGNDYYFGSK